MRDTLAAIRFKISVHVGQPIRTYTCVCVCVPLYTRDFCVSSVRLNTHCTRLISSRFAVINYDFTAVF